MPDARTVLGTVIAVGAVGAVLLLLGSLRGNREAIAAARAEAAQLASQRDSLLTVVQDGERRRAALADERRSQESVITGLLDSVAALERDRAAAQLTVREIRTTGALVDRLRAAFPALGDSAWGLTSIPFEPGDTIGIEYLMVPAWFAETFLIDHQNAGSWQVQNEGLLAVDSLRLAVATLQDSITRLAEARAQAYRAGYQSAYESYGALSERYVAELSRPRIRLGSALGFLLGAGTGIVVVELIR